MSHDVCETVCIFTNNGPVIINKSDFNPNIHSLIGQEKEEVKEEFDREAAKEYLTTLGVQFAKNIGDKKLAELVENMKAKINV